MTAPETATTRVERLLALVPWVAARPDGVPVAEVCERFDIGVTELARDLDTVMMVGVHPFTPDTMIEAWISDGRVLVRYADAFSRPLRLTPREAVGLIAAASGVAAVRDGEDRGPLERAIAKLSGTIGASTDPAVEVDLGDVPRAVFASLEKARRDRRQVTITYPDADERPTTRRIEPAQLFSAGGTWYVSGWCHRAGDNRIFRLDRILAADLTDDAFSRDPFDAPGAIDFGGDFPEVVLEVDRSSAWMLDPVPVMGRVDHGDVVRVALAVGSPRRFARLLVRLGTAARIVESDPGLDLRAEAAAEAERILARYA